MNIEWKRWLLALALLAGWPGAQAAITCTSIASPGVAMFYQDQSTTKVQGTFSVTCSRSSTSDPNFLNYTVTADDGDYPASPNNRARTLLWIFPVYLTYNLITNSACTTGWDNATTIAGRIDWTGNSTGSITQQHNFWSCINTPQNVLVSGTYTDSVVLTLRWGTNNTRTGTFPATITTPASCNITTAPGNIGLSYTAFGPQVTGQTTFAMRCTANMPYTVTVDPAEGVLNGVRYTVGSLPASGSGNGNPQNHTIQAVAPAGQAGQCAAGTCTATRTHQLIITY